MFVFLVFVFTLAVHSGVALFYNTPEFSEPYLVDCLSVSESQQPSLCGSL